MKPADIKTLYERKVRALELRPALGRSTYQAVCRMGENFRCEVDVGGGRTVTVGLPRTEGGDDAAPTPGQLMRASLAACLAMGYVTWAARLEVPIDDVQVTVNATSDAAGQLRPDSGVRPGWLTLGYTVRIVSSAPRADVERVVETADRFSPMLDNLLHGFQPERQLVVEPPGGSS